MGTFSASGGSSAEQHEVAKQTQSSPISDNMSSSLDITAESPEESPHYRSYERHVSLDDYLPDAMIGPEESPHHRSYERHVSLDDYLPEAMIGEILSRLPDMRDLARAQLVNTCFRESSAYVKYVKFLCRQRNVRRGAGQNGECPVKPFKEIVTSKLKTVKCVERLRLEIEDEMQANRYKEENNEKNSLWLSENKFVKEWVPLVCATLQNLTVIDYGQQAIFHPTPLLQHLAQHCKHLRTLELRNMFLDCSPNQCGTTKDQVKENRLKGVSTLTLRCVKLTENGLKDLNEVMPNLRTLTLVTVVGLKDAWFKSDHLQVLCLGLATKVKSVWLEVKQLIKLQLKMACPEQLRVKAPNLRCLAVCMDKRPDTKVEFEGVKDLRELLMGASEFSTLHDLCKDNKQLEKVFLDVPCMAFEDNGGWKGVLPHVNLKNLPDMKRITSFCTQLHTLSVGPGLWHALEQDMTKNPDVFCPTWPNLTRLILHLIVQDMDVSMKLLKALVDAIPTLKTLEVYVHKDSKVDTQEFQQLKETVKKLVPRVDLKLDSWKKGLKFECFSF
ncbi:hypothetical protein Mapa_016940 [Marchantia paleacea]|nr:hypothetical protein Mapa_016940 [Marchantia paleacea]